MSGKQPSARDALVVQAAQASGADILYSEDPSHGRRYGTVRVMNPLVPGELTPGQRGKTANVGGVPATIDIRAAWTGA